MTEAAARKNDGHRPGRDACRHAMRDRVSCCKSARSRGAETRDGEGNGGSRRTKRREAKQTKGILRGLLAPRVCKKRRTICASIRRTRPSVLTPTAVRPCPNSYSRASVLKVSLYLREGARGSMAPAHPRTPVPAHVARGPTELSPASPAPAAAPGARAHTPGDRSWIASCTRVSRFAPPPENLRRSYGCLNGLNGLEP